MKMKACHMKGLTGVHLEPGDAPLPANCPNRIMRSFFEFDSDDFCMQASSTM